MFVIAYIRKRKQKAMENVPKFDVSGNIINAPLHRSVFNRKTVKPEYTACPVQTTERVYFDCKKELMCKLKKFNETNKIKFVRVGYANTRFRFCTKCNDINKDDLLDEYFIESSLKSRSPKALCIGCLGFLLDN